MKVKCNIVVNMMLERIIALIVGVRWGVKK